MEPMGRKKTISMNVLASLALQVVTAINGLVLPKLILVYFGSEVNGLISSLNQFLGFITLLEGGVGGVIMASLYQPLAAGDMEQVSSVVATASKFFRKIAKAYLGYAFLLAVAYPFVVKTRFSWGYIFTLTLIVGSGLFVQYYFSISYRTLLVADQKGFVVSLTQVAIVLLNLAVTLAAIHLYPEIHLVRLCNALLFLLQPILFGRYVSRHYHLNKKAQGSGQLIRQRWDGFGQNLAYFVHSNTDVVLLSLLLTLRDVSVYSVYFMVAGMLKNIVISISQAISPSMGNILARGDEEAKGDAFDLYEFGINLVTTWLFSCAIVLVVPFVLVYTAGISDANYEQPLFGILLLVAEAIYCYRDPFVAAAYASGHFRQTARYAYVEAALNIGISVVLVSQYGIVGVAIGTAVSMLYRLVMSVVYLQRNILQRPAAKWARNILVFIASGLAGVMASNWLKATNISGWAGWLVAAAVTASVCGSVILAACLLFYRKQLGHFISRAKRRE